MITATKQHLTQLESTGLLRLAQTHPELEYLFRHALVQDAAYESLLLTDRKQLHLKAGKTIERLYPDRLDELAPILGQHFDLAGDAQRALEYFILAGDVEARRHANAEAAGHYTRALSIARKKGDAENELHYLGQTLGRVLELNARYDEAMAHYHDMETLAQQRDDPALELISLLGQAILYNTNNPFFDADQGHVIARQALALARNLNDVAAEARSLWALSLHYGHKGQGVQAIAYAEQAIAISRTHHLHQLLPFCLNDISRAYMGMARFSEAKACLTEASTLWRNQNNQHMLVESMVFLAVIDFLRGDFEQSISRTTQAVELAHATDNIIGQGYALGIMGLVLWEQGQIAPTLQVWKDGIKRADNRQFLTRPSFQYAEWGWMCARLGDVERGRQYGQRARDMMRQSNKIPIYFQRWTVAVLARLDVILGDFARAEANLHHPVIDFNSDDFNTLAPIHTHLARVELALAHGQYVQAMTIADAYLERLQGLGIRPSLADILLLKGQALLKLNQPANAYQIINQARAEAEAVGSKRILWEILSVLAGLETDPTEAEVLRRQAGEIIEYIASHTPADLREPFLSLPQVQAVLSKL